MVQVARALRQEEPDEATAVRRNLRNSTPNLASAPTGWRVLVATSAESSEAASARRKFVWNSLFDL